MRQSPKYTPLLNGTFVILHSMLGDSWLNAPPYQDSQWVPYHVCPRQQRPSDLPQWPEQLICPAGLYDIEEISAYAQAHPEDQVDTFETVEDVRREALRRLQQPMQGVGVVVWDGLRCQTNPGVIAKLLEYRTAINAGVTGPFLFRDADNVNHQLPPVRTVALCNALTAAVDAAWIAYFAKKDAIRAATSFEELKKIVPDGYN